MSWEAISAATALLTLLVIAATAVAAIIQLRHMRAGNTISGFIGVMDRWASAEGRALQNYVLGGELEQRLQEPAYRAELASGRPDRLKHPEVAYLDFWESVGMFVKLDYFPEAAMFESGGPIAIMAWEKLKPVIALIRRTRGSTAYDNYEYLVSRAMKWEATHPDGYFPKGTPHLPVPDPWPEDPSAHVR